MNTYLLEKKMQYLTELREVLKTTATPSERQDVVERIKRVADDIERKRELGLGG